MTPRQKIAYGSPCFEAEETTQLKFAWRWPAPNDHWSSILTCNIGLE